MDEQRKRAYRYLLFRVFQDIRESTFFVLNRPRWWSPQFWRRMLYVLRRIHAISDWLHDIAQVSATDFEGFDEKLFWEEMETLNQRMPDLGLPQYKEAFEHELRAALSGLTLALKNRARGEK